MTDAYPGGSEAVDQQLGERVTDLRTEMRSGFERQERTSDRIERQFKEVVSKATFDATVERIDAQRIATDTRVDEGLSSVRSEFADGIANVEGKIKDVENEINKGFLAISDDAEKRSVKARWLVTIGFTALTVIQAIVFNVMGIMAGK